MPTSLWTWVISYAWLCVSSPQMKCRWRLETCKANHSCSTIFSLHPRAFISLHYMAVWRRHNKRRTVFLDLGKRLWFHWEREKFWHLIFSVATVFFWLKWHWLLKILSAVAHPVSRFFFFFKCVPNIDQWRNRALYCAQLHNRQAFLFLFLNIEFLLV